jgi:hypothetical protein
MDDQIPDSLGKALAYEDILPVRWSATNADLSDAYYLGLNDANDEILRAVGILDEHSMECTEDGAQCSPEYARIDFKLNVLIELMGQFLSQQTPLPERCPVRLGATFMEWQQSDMPPTVGDKVMMEIFLSRRYPRALSFPGIIHDSMQTADGWKVTVLFPSLNDKVVEGLEKFVFRHHRRQIAQSRRSS